MDPCDDSDELREGLKRLARCTFITLVVSARMIEWSTPKGRNTTLPNAASTLISKFLPHVVGQDALAAVAVAHPLRVVVTVSVENTAPQAG